MKKDRNWSTFLDDPVRYADAINGFGCNGEQLVSATDLQDADTQYRGMRIPSFTQKIANGQTWKKAKRRNWGHGWFRISYTPNQTSFPECSETFRNSMRIQKQKCPDRNAR